MYFIPSHSSGPCLWSSERILVPLICQNREQRQTELFSLLKYKNHQHTSVQDPRVNSEGRSRKQSGRIMLLTSPHTPSPQQSFRLRSLSPPGTCRWWWTMKRIDSHLLPCGKERQELVSSQPVWFPATAQGVCSTVLLYGCNGSQCIE